MKAKGEGHSPHRIGTRSRCHGHSLFTPNPNPNPNPNQLMKPISISVFLFPVPLSLLLSRSFLSLFLYSLFLFQHQSQSIFHSNNCHPPSPVAYPTIFVPSRQSTSRQPLPPQATYLPTKSIEALENTTPLISPSRPI